MSESVVTYRIEASRHTHEVSIRYRRRRFTVWHRVWVPFAAQPTAAPADDIRLCVRGWPLALAVSNGRELWRAYNTGPDADVKFGANFMPFYAKDRNEGQT